MGRHACHALLCSRSARPPLPMDGRCGGKHHHILHKIKGHSVHLSNSLIGVLIDTASFAFLHLEHEILVKRNDNIDVLVVGKHGI